MRRDVTTVDDLRAIVGHPNSYVANKVGNRLSAAQRHWLAHSPGSPGDHTRDPVLIVPFRILAVTFRS